MNAFCASSCTSASICTSIQSGKVIEEELINLQELASGLENTIDQLRALQGSTQARLDEIKSHGRALHLGEGLEKLPNELLSRIFYFAIQPLETNDLMSDIIRAPQMEDVLSLSHVNQRFLHVARATQDLWTTITRLAPLGIVEAFLQRSGVRGLKVFQSYNHRRVGTVHGLEQALCTVVHHASRLELLSLCMDEGKRQEAVHRIIMDAENLKFPRLVKLNVVCPFDDTYQEELMYGTLLEGRVPNLRSLDVPGYMLGACAVETLTSVHLDCQERCTSGDAAFSVDDLLAALEELPSLRKLSLDMNYDTRWAVQYRNSRLPNVVLPTILDLQISTSSNIATDAVGNIMLNASFPNLEVLDLILGTMNSRSDGDESDSILSVVRSLGNSRQKFMHLHTFSLGRFAYSDAGLPDEVHPSDAEVDERMLLRMPALKDISFYAAAPAPTLALLGTEQLPFLESVSLYRCEHVGGYDILAMVKGRNSDSRGRVSHLTKLVVKDCLRLNERDYGPIKIAMEGYGLLDMDYYGKVPHS